MLNKSEFIGYYEIKYFMNEKEMFLFIKLLKIF